MDEDCKNPRQLIIHTTTLENTPESITAKEQKKK